MEAATETDPRVDVVAYLDRRRCAACRSRLSAVAVGDVTRSPYSPKFRCPFPHPTCWRIACPGCGQHIVIAVRKGKAWAPRRRGDPPQSDATGEVRRLTSAPADPARRGGLWYNRGSCLAGRAADLWR